MVKVKTIDLTRFKMIENEMDLHGTKFLDYIWG
jgi:hypothetical protein